MRHGYDINPGFYATAPAGLSLGKRDVSIKAGNDRCASDERAHVEGQNGCVEDDAEVPGQNDLFVVIRTRFGMGHIDLFIFN